MKIKSLSAPGNEIICFLKDVDSYSKSFNLYLNKIKEHFPYSQKEAIEGLNSKLMHKNWTINEARSYVAYTTQAMKFAREAGVFFLNAILVRYLRLVLSQHDNKLAIEIITDLFITAIKEHMTKIMRTLFSKESESENDAVQLMLGEIGASSWNFIFNYTHGFSQAERYVGKITNRFLTNEAQRVIDSIDALQGR